MSIDTSESHGDSRHSEKSNCAGSVMSQNDNANEVKLRIRELASQAFEFSKELTISEHNKDSAFAVEKTPFGFLVLYKINDPDAYNPDDLGNKMALVFSDGELSKILVSADGNGAVGENSVFRAKEGDELFMSTRGDVGECYVFDDRDSGLKSINAPVMPFIDRATEPTSRMNGVFGVNDDKDGLVEYTMYPGTYGPKLEFFGDRVMSSSVLPEAANIRGREFTYEMESDIAYESISFVRDRHEDIIASSPDESVMVNIVSPAGVDTFDKSMDNELVM